MATTFGELAAMGDLPRHWWVVALRGLAAIIFGIGAFIWPGLTVAVLVLLFGAYAIVDGLLAVYVGLRSAGQQRWTLVLEGLVGTAAGLVAFFWPALTALALLLVIAVWAILTGIIEIVVAVRLRQVIQHEWAMVLSGALSVIFGVLLLVQPGAGALAVVWLIGTYAVLFGAALLALVWHLRALHGPPDQAPAGARQTGAA